MQVRDWLEENVSWFGVLLVICIFGLAYLVCTVDALLNY